MVIRPKVFLSYSHEDRDTAEKIAKDLRLNGIDVWFDKWEILPGDSLIQKIFEEGLSGANAFIILISKNSVESKWVKQELDTAFIKRIEGITRIIPLIIGDVKIPIALSSLKWINLNEFDDALHELKMAIFKVRERPPIGIPPSFIKNSLRSVGGLSPLSTTLGLALISTGKYDLGDEEMLSAKELSEKLEFSPEEIDDAIDELESFGLVKTINYLGTYPFSHGLVAPTYAMFLHFKGEGLDYDPEDDIKTIVSYIVANKEIDGKTLVEKTKLSPLRINRAIAYLKDYGIIRTIDTLGTAPFNFNTALATGVARRFVAENCK
jgi:hypothetical protein